MRISTFAATDVGLVRPGNEYSYFRGTTVVAVADGLGGHQAGEVASATAIEPVAELDRRTFTTPEEAREALVGAIEEGNQAVIAKAVSDSAYWGMGTTMTAGAIAGGRWLQLAHVGDSRAYLLHAGHLRQLTNDHTVVAELVREERIAEILRASGDGQRSCQALLDAANAAGGPDNITVVLLRAEG